MSCLLSCLKSRSVSTIEDSGPQCGFAAGRGGVASSVGVGRRYGSLLTLPHHCYTPSERSSAYYSTFQRDLSIAAILARQSFFTTIAVAAEVQRDLLRSYCTR